MTDTPDDRGTRAADADEVMKLSGTKNAIILGLFNRCSILVPVGVGWPVGPPNGLG